MRISPASCLLVIALAISMTGCSVPAESPGEAPLATTTLGEDWDLLSSKAPEIAQDLESSGLCQYTFTEADGVYGGDILVDYRKDEHRRCSSWPQNEDASGLTCPAMYSVNTGAAAHLYSPKRSLSYEDGASVALYYGSTYTVEVSPANGGSMSGEEMVSECSGLVSKLNELIGGEVTKYGDYENAPVSEDESSSSNTNQIETVQVPNVVGMLDGVAKNELFMNGYSFYLDIKSTGFNPKQSCLMSGQNVILAQSPSPGSVVNNDSSTRLTVKVNCEF